MADLGHSIADVRHRRSGDESHSSSQLVTPIVGMLGDFCIVREIGRGGMGIVYEAEQSSIGRRVALKVLPFAAMLDKQQLNRFKNEARAAGTLDHPNIVSVYSVGSERGVHYYAMQLIEGQSLAEVIAARQQRSVVGGPRLEVREATPNGNNRTDTKRLAATPIGVRGGSVRDEPATDTQPVAALSTLPDFDTQEYFKTVAQLGIQAAEALDHAHQNGIVHRDVKPGNLLVDTEGKLYVTDFGLARIEADAGMTMTGDLLGTLRYMSPEQALAKRVVVDHRTDVYSLGATLYELLALQPAYQGSDRQELLKQIAFEEPKKLQQINHLTPVDLETIIAKAMDKDPGDRYATAQELADDLRRYTANQPIKARQPTMLQQISKWSRRNKTFVTTAAISVAVFVVISLLMLAASNVVITRERNEKAAALKRAESNFQRVLAVIDRSLDSVSDQTLADVPQLEELRKTLMDDALEFYEQLLEENPSDLKVQFAAARAQVRLGMLNELFRNWRNAIRLNDSAIAILNDLRHSDPANAAYRYELGTALKQRCWCASAIPMSPEADASYARRAVELFQGLHDDYPGKLTYQAALLEALLNLDNRSKTEDLEAFLKRIVQLADHPQMTKRLRGEVSSALAYVAQQQDRLDEAEEHFREAVRFHREGVEENPSEGLARSHLVRAYNGLGVFLEGQGKLEEAIEAFCDSFEVGLSIRRDFPRMQHYDEFSLYALTRLDRDLSRLGRFDEAEEKLSKWEMNSCEDYFCRGMQFYSIQQFEKAIDDFSTAIELGADAEDAIVLTWREAAHIRLGEHAQAMSDFRTSNEIDPDSWEPYRVLAELLAAANEEGLRDGKQAVTMATKAFEMTDYKNADCVATLAAARAEAGEYEQAIEWSHRAIELLGGR